MPHNFAVNAYGIPHTMGFLAARDGAVCERPWTLRELASYARANDLAGIDTPLPVTMDAREVQEILNEHQLRLVVECMGILSTDLSGNIAAIRKAKDSGAKVARFILSMLLCGDRRPMRESGGWFSHREQIAERLRELLPIADDMGMSVALENHQDAGVDDFLWLYEASGKRESFGVCLDAGNPLSVLEDPVETARTLAPLIRHLHVKDYTIHAAPEGYRLVRCPAGTGVVDFPEILKIVRGNGFPGLLPGIEIAAQATRTIPFLDADWWKEYGPRDFRTALGALKIFWGNARPASEPYSSAWERGENSAIVFEEEARVLAESVKYFQGLGL